MTEKEADLLIINQVKSGDKNAFDKLVSKYQRRVSAIVSRFVSDHDAVQDVTQEAFLKAYLGLKNFRGESAFYTWLYRIAVNAAKNHLAARSRSALHSSDDINETETGTGSSNLRDICDPESHMAKSQVEKALHFALDSLPADFKQSITLREFKGFSYEQIANIEKCPIGTVRSRVSRARESIRMELSGALQSA